MFIEPIDKTLNYSFSFIQTKTEEPNPEKSPPLQPEFDESEQTSRPTGQSQEAIEHCGHQKSELPSSAYFASDMNGNIVKPDANCFPAKVQRKKTVPSVADSGMSVSGTKCQVINADLMQATAKNKLMAIGKFKETKSKCSSTKLINKSSVKQKVNSQPAPKITTVKKEVYIRCENLNDTLDQEILASLPRATSRRTKVKKAKSETNQNSKTAVAQKKKKDSLFGDENFNPNPLMNSFSGVTIRKRKIDDSSSVRKFFKSRDLNSQWE